MVGYGPQGCKESDMTEAAWHTRTHTRHYLSAQRLQPQTQGLLLGFLYLLIPDSQLGEKQA